MKSVWCVFWTYDREGNDDPSCSGLHSVHATKEAAEAATVAEFEPEDHEAYRREERLGNCLAWTCGDGDVWRVEPWAVEQE